MNKLTHRAALITLAALTLGACPNTHTSSPAIAPDQTAQLPQLQSSKPETAIGLAPGGGASKGSVHIGVVKVLRESGIPVKVVISTSTGSIVGNLYASGISPDRLELEAEILGRTGLVDLVLSTSGFVKGEKLQNYINYKVGSRLIQQFPLEFAAVATDFEIGKTTAFNCGSAGQAVRVSASTSNVFQPTVIGDRKYVNDDLSQLVPVSAAKTQGANFVIAVDASARPTKNANQSSFSYLGQALSITSTSALYNELGKTDTVIKPKALELSSVDGSDQKSRVIQLGEQAARVVLPGTKRGLATYRY